MNSQGFDPKDLEEICSRKPKKYKMKKADFKEFGRNAVLGIFDVALGGLQAAAIISSISTNKHKKLENHSDGFRDGHSGYGFYFGDIREDD